MPKLKRKKGESKEQQYVRSEMHEMKRGELHSGSKKGPVVKDRKQAIAIGLNEARREGGGSTKGRGSRAPVPKSKRKKR